LQRAERPHGRVKISKLRLIVQLCDAGRLLAREAMTKGIAVGDTLTEGQKLVKGESLTSSNGAYSLTLQDDGNLVLASRGHSVWASGTNGEDVVRAEVQNDGNFVLYSADKPVWHTDTKGKKNVRLVLQDDRNLVLYSADGSAWSTKTETDAPPPPEPEAEAAPAAEPVAEPVAEEVAAQEPEPEPAARTYTVESGDTLWAISERFYGDGSKYQVIADASGIPNPDLIQPGQVLTIP
jgi:LysM repeat protein